MLVRDFETRATALSVTIDEMRHLIESFEPPMARPASVSAPQAMMPPTSAPAPEPQAASPIEAPTPAEAPPVVEEPPADEAEVLREEVRRAVMAARAEIEGEPVEEPRPHIDMTTPPKVVHAQPAHMASIEDELAPSSIVIEDPDGRIELARVYDVLHRLDCAAHAVLLNYAPHSVSVGLGGRVPVPTAEAIEAAVKAAFGRTCMVMPEGNRISVRVAAAQDRVA